MQCIYNWIHLRIGAAIFPTLFLHACDAADYSNIKTEEGQQGLFYSAGSFATKFGGVLTVQ
jgi:GPH family glycoside/pentoside/hexuronide:cation symporter